MRNSLSTTSVSPQKKLCRSCTHSKYETTTPPALHSTNAKYRHPAQTSQRRKRRSPVRTSQSLLHGNRRSKRLKTGTGVVAEVRRPGPFWRGVRFGDPLQKRRAKGSEAGTGMVNEIRRARQLRSGV